MLRAEFSGLLPRLAVGLVGPGSEVAGDLMTRYPMTTTGVLAFCLWLQPEDLQESGPGLARAYAKLPREYLGYRATSRCCPARAAGWG